MAKVGKENVLIGSDSIEFDVFFSKTDGFYAKVPKLILEQTDKVTQVFGSSYDNAVLKMKEFVTKFSQEGMKTKKVIAYVYKSRVPAYQFRPDPKNPTGDYIPFKYWARDHSYQSKKARLAIELDYDVLYYTEFYEKKYVSHTDPTADPAGLREAYLYKTGTGKFGGYSPDSDFNAYTLIDHTPELEEWFKLTTNALEALVKKVDEFFGKNSEQLLENISKNQLLLS